MGGFSRHPSPDDGAPSAERPRPVPRTRAAGAWVGLVASALVLLLLLIFILQNGQRSEIHFLGADGRLPMGVALLLAAVFGALAAAVPATVRIVQLRRLAVRRDSADPAPPPMDGTADPPSNRPKAADDLPNRLPDSS